MRNAEVKRPPHPSSLPIPKQKRPQLRRRQDVGPAVAVDVRHRDLRADAGLLVDQVRHELHQTAGSDRRHSDLQAELPEAELARRREKWTKPEPREKRGVLAKYARTVRSASEGAVTG